MKERTRVVAWVFLAVSGYCWLSLLLRLTSFHILQLLSVGMLIAGAVALPLWVFLLRRQSWAWLGLTVLYSAVLLLEARRLVLVPGRFLRAGASIQEIAFWTAFLSIPVLVYVIPLWAVLTDRPSGWASDPRPITPELQDETPPARNDEPSTKNQER